MADGVGDDETISERTRFRRGQSAVEKVKKACTLLESDKQGGGYFSVVAFLVEHAIGKN